MLLRTRWAVVGVFVSVLGVSVAWDQTSLTYGEDRNNPSSEADDTSILPELLSISSIGPHEISDIAPTSEGFLLATGAGVSRWRYVDGIPRHHESILRADGSPLGFCQKLLADKKGGIWICGVRGVGYLARKMKSPQWFTVKHGLPEGGVRDMVLSADEERLWIVGPDGLATTKTGKIRWRVYKKNNLVDLVVHPSKNVAWCRQLLRSPCACGRQLATVQFDLSAERWTAVPGTANCAHVAPRLELYRETNSWAWFSDGHDPPSAIDLKSNTVHTWPRQPNWERIDKEGVTRYSDSLGQVVSARDETGDIWCASGTGVWRYDRAANRWQGYKHLAKPLYGNPKVIWSHDERTLYWSCNGTVAAFDTTTHTWRQLWWIYKLNHQSADDPLLLSPNGETLWQTGPWGLAVGDPDHHTGRVLNDKAVLGLSKAKFVRFDDERKLALIATPRGVVITDYHGVPRATLTIPHPHVEHRIVEFRFSGDGNEVWCLTKNQSGFPMPAHVFFPKTRQWQSVPEAESKGSFFDVAFSKDGGTVWLSHHRADEEHTPLVQRKSGTTTWKPLVAKMPEWHGRIDRFHLTPKGDELWMATFGSGLFRARLGDGQVTHYEEEHVMEYDGVVLKPLVGDYVGDLAFVQGGSVAVCAAGGGGKEGLSLIELKTNTVKNLPLGEISPIEHLVVDPDDRTITCVFNNAPSRKFDTKERKWIEKGPVGVGDGVWRPQFNPVKPPAVQGGGILISSERGIAKVDGKGKELDLFSPAPGETGFAVPYILPIPGSDEHLCAMTRKGRTEIYRLNTRLRRLRLVRRFVGDVTALKIAPDGRVWAGLAGQIVCFDSRSGNDFPLRPKGESRPTAAAVVKDLPDAVFAGITVAPRKTEQVRVLPPQKSPKLGKAVAMENSGMVWPSTHRPVIATSESGKRYVMWFAYPGKTKATAGGLPLIPQKLFSKIATRSSRAATGLRAWSENKWSAPQLLLSGEKPPHDVRAAWCRGEDLHVLIDTGDSNRLTHLRFQAAEKKWTRIAELGHDVRRIVVRKRSTHLVTSDFQGKRFGYRVFDGDRWSDVHWFDRRGDYEGVTLTVTADAHLIWNDGDGVVAHAVITSAGKSQVFRNTFRERRISKDDSRHYVSVAGPGGSLALMYTAELYSGHPDHGLPHICTWLGDRWSAPKTIPFPTRGFGYPMVV